MLLVVVSIFDSAIQAYGRPAFVPHIGAAQRGFTDEVNNKSSQSEIAAHPEDYELYELGVFDDSKASFALLEEPRLVLRGKDCVQLSN